MIKKVFFLKIIVVVLGLMAALVAAGGVAVCTIEFVKGIRKIFER